MGRIESSLFLELQLTILVLNLASKGCVWMRSLSLVLHTVSVPVLRCAAVGGDQLQLGGEAYAEIADGGDLGTCRPQATSVGDLPASSGSGVQLIPE